MIIQIKELRIKIDGLSQLTKELEQSNEIKECTQSLLLGKCWLGKILFELGQETPYANDGNRKTIGDIEPTADTYNGTSRLLVNSGAFDFEKGLSYIEKIDLLREEINKVLVETQSKLNFIKQQKISYDSLNYICLYQKNIYTHLSEARFWLGFELSRLRDELKEENNKK